MQTDCSSHENQRQTLSSTGQEMGTIDIDLLLEPLPGDTPTGDDLEYDQKFVELCLMAQGVPDRVEIVRDPNDSNRDIERVVPGSEPDATAVLDASLALFQRTKDLRIAMHAAYALTRIDGLAGLASGSGLIAGMLERYWHEVHPRLGTDDGSEPFMRINILNGFCDQAMILRAVRNMPLAGEGTSGRYKLSDAYEANDALPHKEGAATRELLRSACMDMDAVVLGIRLAACRNTLANLTSIASIFHERTSFFPDFEPLKKILRRTISIYSTDGQSGAIGANKSADTAPDRNMEHAERHKVERIVSRADAKLLLEQACNYLEQAEPAHPSPLLIRRAIRLLDMSFINIIRELTPDAVSEIERLGGIRN